MLRKQWFEMGTNEDVWMMMRRRRVKEPSLPISYWPGMTTLSSDAPSSSHPALPSAPLPSSVLVSLPAQLSSCYPYHNRSISCNISNLNKRDKISVFCSFFPLHLYLPRIPARRIFFPSLLRFLAFLPASPLSIFFAAFSAKFLFLPRVTSVYHPKICNGAAHASC
ncbi:hypothetical protein ILYODFUR_034358 [Ilyodon furcidens]|uniref:Uncharacterized protein n=1 Tax=Ilyodon furcidens TaxID=33524 RepID=A0ABV0TDG6_9TELE